MAAPNASSLHPIFHDHKVMQHRATIKALHTLITSKLPESGRIDPAGKQKARREAGLS